MLQALIKLINLLVLLVLSLFVVEIFADLYVGCDTNRDPDVPCTSASGVVDAFEG